MKLALIHKIAVAAALAATATSVQAVNVSNGDILTITAGVTALDASGNITSVTDGSFVGFDLNSNEKIETTEMIPLSQGTTGLTIGQSPTGLGEIDAQWMFIGASSYHYVNSASVTGGTTDGLDMRGFMFNWNDSDFDISHGAWQVLNGANGQMPTSGYTDGTALFSWDGTNGGAYTLDYTATTANGIEGLQYALHLEGTVTTVPEASTYGMMLTGLGLVSCMVVRSRRMVSLNP